MQNVGSELRNIAMTAVAKAYLCHGIESNVLTLSSSGMMPIDPLLQDLYLMLLTEKVFIREGARDLNTRLDGDLPIIPGYYHHTRRHGLLTSYESILFSNKVEAYLRNHVYQDIAMRKKKSPGKVIDEWAERLQLDPSWSERMIRTFRNHLVNNYPVFA